MSWPLDPGALPPRSAIGLAALGCFLAARLPAGEPAAGHVLRANIFEGRVWIPERTLSAQLGLEPGSRIDGDAVKEALERLLSFRFIESAGRPRAAAAEGGDAVDLIWPIRERRIARKVTVAMKPGGRGGAFSPRDLEEGLRTRMGQPVVLRDLEEDRRAIRARYVEAGFPLCEVEASERGVGPGTVEVDIAVEEGPRVWLRSIEIEGDLEVPRGQVLDVLHTRPRILFGLVSRGSFDPERFGEDVERVRELYRDRGYLEALVAEEPPRFSPGFQELTAAIRIEEGPRYTLSRVRVHGNGPGVPADLLLAQVRTRPGRPYDGVSLEEDRRRLVRWYEEHYDRVPAIEIRREYRLDPSDHRVAVVFEILESIHLRTGRVDIRGNVRTRDRVIRAAAAVRPGAPLTEIVLDRSAQGIGELGCFAPEKVVVTPLPGGEVRDVEVKVEERRTGYIEVGGGAGSGEGEIAHLSVTQTNFDIFAIPGKGRPLRDAFSGGGQRLQLVFEPGTIESELRLSFEEPYLYNSRHSLFLQTGGWQYDRDAYDETGIAGEVALKRLWDEGRRLSTSLAFIPEDVRISGISRNAPPEVTEVRGHTFISYPSLRIAWSDLDLNYWRGPAGVFAEARGDIASDGTGSEVDFVRTQVRADLFQPVSRWIDEALGRELLGSDPRREHVVRLGGRFGWSEGLGGDDVPIFERFFLGGPQGGTFHRAGAEGFRGFDYRGVGPEANGVRTGGRAYYHGIAEYSFPVVLPELRAVALFEVADIEPEFSRLSTGRIRTAAGGGLRLRLRLLGQPFPMDFYFVQALSRERGDDDRFFTFTIGLGF